MATAAVRVAAPPNLALLPAASSIMHEHLCAVILTELARRPNSAQLRLLDIGCGDGTLLAYLQTTLASMRPDVELIAHGLDVLDHGVQPAGFLDWTGERLSRLHPETNWKSRLHAIFTNSPWPFPDDSFDVIISNQVGEHVGDHSRFFHEVSRTLKPGGFSVHLFPVGHYLYEGHLLLPFVHWIRDHDLLQAVIAGASKLGIGKYREHRRLYGATPESYAEAHADYLSFYTNYISFREVSGILRKCGLRASRRYTPQLYWAKARALLSRSRHARYARHNAIVEAFLAAAFSYISSITLFAEKKNVYRNPGSPC